MRYMRYMKRFLLFLCLAACFFLLTACGKTDLGKRMTEAGVNTLVGMGTVFVVLIFISLLISCFKFISVFENKIKKAPVPEPPSPIIEEEEDLTDDLELAAVITAAIAADTGSSPSGLVVRSIRRAPEGNWKKA